MSGESIIQKEKKEHATFESTFEKYKDQLLTLPVDEDGYVEGFEYNDEKGLSEFFDKYGVVVIKNLLTPDEIERTQNEIYDYVELYYNPDFKRNDPNTWNVIGGNAAKLGKH